MLTIPKTIDRGIQLKDLKFVIKEVVRWIEEFDERYDPKGDRVFLVNWKIY